MGPCFVLIYLRVAHCFHFPFIVLSFSFHEQKNPWGQRGFTNVRDRGLFIWGTPFWASQNAFLNKGFHLKSMIWGGLFFSNFQHFNLKHIFIPNLNFCILELNSNAIAFPIKNNSTFSYAKPPSPGGCSLIWGYLWLLRWYFLALMESSIGKFSGWGGRSLIWW